MKSLRNLLFIFACAALTPLCSAGFITKIDFGMNSEVNLPPGAACSVAFSQHNTPFSSLTEGSIACVSSNPYSGASFRGFAYADHFQVHIVSYDSGIRGEFGSVLLEASSIYDARIVGGHGTGLVTFDVFACVSQYNLSFSALGYFVGVGDGCNNEPPPAVPFVFGRSFTIDMFANATTWHGPADFTLQLTGITVTDLAGNPIPGARLVIVPEASSSIALLTTLPLLAYFARRHRLPPLHSLHRCGLSSLEHQRPL